MKEDWVLCRVFHKTKTSSEHHNCSSNHGCCQPNAAMLPCVTGQNQISSFSSTQNSNMLSNHMGLLNNNNSNAIFKFSAQEDKNPVTAGSSVTEMTSVDGGGGEGRGDYDFLWDMNLEEINSLVPSNEQGTLHEQMDANNLPFF
ncbi:unnamed protein product [Rhodiola kirilowii]